MIKLIRVLLLVLWLSVALASARVAQSRFNPALSEMIQALGGQSFLEVKEIHTTGRFFSFSRGELTGSDLFADYIKFPDMERTEFGREKNKSITINRGKEGWKIEPKKESGPQSAVEAEDFLANFKTSFDYVLRFVINDPKTTVQNLPSELADFKRVDVVELRDPAKNLIRFFVDRDTRLPVKMQVRRADRAQVNEEQYGNWHKFQSVNTPLFLSRSRDGVKTMEIRLETAAYNGSLPDSLFAIPVK